MVVLGSLKVDRLLWIYWRF